MKKLFIIIHYLDMDTETQTDWFWADSEEDAKDMLNDHMMELFGSSVLKRIKVEDIFEVPIPHEVRIEILNDKEICYECGCSVKAGSGNFVNRIPSLDTFEERVEMNVPYPQGKWLCAQCDEKANE